MIIYPKSYSVYLGGTKTLNPIFYPLKGTIVLQILLGGPWDLVTTYNWTYSPTYNFPERAYRGYPNYK